VIVTFVRLTRQSSPPPLPPLSLGSPRRSIELGAIDFIVKPYSFASVQARVAKTLEQAAVRMRAAPPHSSPAPSAAHLLTPPGAGGAAGGGGAVAIAAAPPPAATATTPAPLSHTGAAAITAPSQVSTPGAGSGLRGLSSAIPGGSDDMYAVRVLAVDDALTIRKFLA